MNEGMLGRRWFCLICDRLFYDLQQPRAFCPICKKSDIEISPRGGYYESLEPIKNETISQLGGSMELVQKKTKNGNFTSKIKDLGILHCEDGPAVICGERKEWHYLGELHRVGGPAIDPSDNEDMKEWHFHGQLHRLDGPAQEYSAKMKRDNYWAKDRHYIFGKHLTPAQFKKITSNELLMKDLRAMEAKESIKFETAKPNSSKESSGISFLPMLAAGGLLAGAGMMYAKTRNNASAKAAEKATIAV